MLGRTFLAHEMVHAGQAEATAESEAALDAMMERAQAKAMSRLSEEEIAQHQSHLMQAMEAADYHTARQHIADYVDQAAMPQRLETLSHLHQDPEFMKYVEEMEPSAVAIENQVANLRGEPLRAGYLTPHEIPPEMMREMAIDEVSRQLKIADKPVLSTPRGRRWVDSLGPRGCQIGG